jgi:hypothetical protein
MLFFFRVRGGFFLLYLRHKISSSSVVFVLDGELERLESGLLLGWFCGPRHELAFIMQVPPLQRVLYSLPE